ncbi:PilZ domain-containing protein [Roseospira navarrensis]|uniref:PilZ domain-containing protein n=1 Tax=Roseospira navarrensis TaxID=140058 RepID=A0A7X1ZGM1_9PROT|nr:PilZ domain-containing protein [Roseospira navarrensis]MQX38007.1 hypothetical protein [Roseospira navarrensis]
MTADHGSHDSDDHGPRRRSARRRRVLKGGWLVLGDGSSSIRCFVKDISATGARIETQDGDSAPQGRLTLTLSDGETLEAEVVRRSGVELGIRFVPPGQHPSLAPPPDRVEQLIDRMDAMGLQTVLDEIEALGLMDDPEVAHQTEALMQAYTALYGRLSSKVGPW